MQIKLTVEAVKNKTSYAIDVSKWLVVAILIFFAIIIIR